MHMILHMILVIILFLYFYYSAKSGTLSCMLSRA